LLPPQPVDKNHRAGIAMVYIVLLNWNGWRDTLECLESVFRLTGAPFRVVVCDNGSTDGSAEHLRAWADGNLDVYVPEAKTLRTLTFPPISKPVRYIAYDASKPHHNADDAAAPLVIIENGADLGFAAGNNPGIRYALEQADMDFVWLLNNDTVVEPHALEALVQRAHAQPTPGICGSTIRYYFAPDRVQALGGAIDQNLLARCRLVGANTLAQAPVDSAKVEKRIDFIYGASMLVSRIFLEDVGLLNERYFLYCEEVDWALRAGGRYRWGYARDSVIYHRDGGATQHGQSAFAHYHSTRSGLLLTWTYRRWRFPLFLGVLALRVFKRAVTGDLVAARGITRAILTTPFWRRSAGRQKTTGIGEPTPAAGDAPSL
jgi:GT2 family glycosyltransferase